MHQTYLDSFALLLKLGGISCQKDVMFFGSTYFRSKPQVILIQTYCCFFHLTGIKKKILNLTCPNIATYFFFLLRNKIPLKSFLYWLFPIPVFPVSLKSLVKVTSDLQNAKVSGCFSVLISFDIHNSIFDTLYHSFLLDNVSFLLGKFSNCKVQTDNLENIIKIRF